MGLKMCDFSNIIVNISPPKCGTTSLYFSLINNSHVSNSMIKEPRFFATDESDIFEDIPPSLRVKGNYGNGFGWHLGLFSTTSPDDYLIDFTTYYSVTRETPSLLKKHYPRAKFFFVMRDPVERYISHYYQYRKMGIILPDIGTLIRQESDLSNFFYSFCNYKDTYLRYAEEFGEESICILLFSDLLNNKEKVEELIAAFLGFDCFSYDPTDKEKNRSGVPRYGELQSFLFGENLKSITKYIPSHFKPTLLWLRKKIVLLNTRDEKYPELVQADKLYLNEKLNQQISFYDSVS